jgi:polyhydroxyalkanoate synthesis regulator phasin
MKKLSLIAAVSLVALLALGATTANAHRGPGYGAKGVNASALVTQAAKQLDVTRAKLKTAIVEAAQARIDEAVDDGDVDADEADDLKSEAEDNLGFAMAVSRTKTVASNLGITTAKLNSGFRAARKALIEARIDKAVKNGDLTEEEAADLKAELDEEDLPGYKAGGGFAFGFDSGAGSPGERGHSPGGQGK